MITENCENEEIEWKKKRKQVIAKTLKRLKDDCRPPYVREDCFAYHKLGEEESCSALVVLDCRGCKFYKPESEMKNGI